MVSLASRSPRHAAGAALSPAHGSTAAAGARDGADASQFVIPEALANAVIAATNYADFSDLFPSPADTQAATAALSEATEREVRRAVAQIESRQSKKSRARAVRPVTVTDVTASPSGGRELKVDVHSDSEDSNSDREIIGALSRHRIRQRPATSAATGRAAASSDDEEQLAQASDPRVVEHITAELNRTRTRLVGCVHELFQTEAALKTACAELMQWRAQFEQALVTQHLLYGEYRAAEAKWQRETKAQAEQQDVLRSQLDRAVAELDTAKDHLNAVRMAAESAGSGSVEGQIAQAVEGYARELMVLRVNEKQLARRCNTLEHELQQSAGREIAVSKQAREMQGVLRQRISQLTRESQTNHERVRHLSTLLQDSVPRAELDKLSRRHTVMTSKYTELLSECVVKEVKHADLRDALRENIRLTQDLAMARDGLINSENARVKLQDTVDRVIALGIDPSKFQVASPVTDAVATSGTAVPPASGEGIAPPGVSTAPHETQVNPTQPVDYDAKYPIAAGDAAAGQNAEARMQQWSRKLKTRSGGRDLSEAAGTQRFAHEDHGMLMAAGLLAELSSALIREQEASRRADRTKEFLQQAQANVVRLEGELTQTSSKMAGAEKIAHEHSAQLAALRNKLEGCVSFRKANELTEQAQALKRRNVELEGIRLE